MAVTLSSGSSLSRPRSAPSFPFWQRVFLRVESLETGYFLSNRGTVAPPHLGTITVNNGNMAVGSGTSWGGSSANMPWDVSPYSGASLASLLVQYVDENNARVYRVGNTTGTLLNFSNPSSAELVNITRVVLAAEGTTSFTYAEFAEGTGTLTGQNITDLLGTSPVESISGITLTNNSPLNPAGSAGSAVTGSLTSLLGDDMSVTGTVTISSRTHPVTRSAAPTLSNPSAQTVTEPAAFTMSSTVTGTYTGYVWQRSMDGGTTFATVPDGTGASGGGATGGTLTYTSTATGFNTGNHRNGYRYRLRLTYDSGTVDSANALLTVNAIVVPLIDTPTRSTPTGTTVAPGFTTNTATGTARGIVIQSATTPTTPSIAQVKAGQNSAGNTTGVTALTNLAITSTGVKVFATTTIPTTSLTYWPFIVHTDGSSNDSAVLIGPPHYPGTGRPVSDISAGGYTSTGATFSEVLNEDTANDSTFISSPALVGSFSGGPIMTLDKPYTAGTYTAVKVRKWVTGGSAGEFKVVFLNDSNTVMGETVTQAMGVTPTTYTLSVTLTGTATRIQIQDQG